MTQEMVCKREILALLLSGRIASLSWTVMIHVTEFGKGHTPVCGCPCIYDLY